MVVLLLSNAHVTKSEGSIKVLVDESHGVDGIGKAEQEEHIEKGSPRDTDWSFSFNNDTQPWGMGSVRNKIQEVASVDVKKSGTLSYSSLKDYDVLIIASFTESYSSAEADAIKEFVEKGGSLLMLADYEYPCNSVSRSFDVIFTSESALIAEKKGIQKVYTYLALPILWSWTVPRPFFFYVEDITQHPVTEGVDKLGMSYVIPITSHKTGKVLARTTSDSWLDTIEVGFGSKEADEEAGPFDIVLAMENIGKGRAVFIGSFLSFRNSVTDGLLQSEKENLTLIRNAVEWLGQPGGPYKQYKIINEQAQQKITDATSLYDSHNFSGAKSTFNEAITLFEQSIAIYPNADANKGIDSAKAYVAKCETGIEADEAFDNAMSLFNSREYEKAIEEFEKAKSLYDEIEYTEKADECTEKVDESNNWITLRDKATQELTLAEEALGKAPSAFSTAGYQDARAKFEQAKSTWEEYNDPAQVKTCEEKITLCNNEIAKIKRNVVMIVVGVVVVVVVVVVVFVLMRRRKPKAAEAPQLTVREEPPEPSPPGSDPTEILKDRYAKGEITKEEFEKLMSSLQKE